MFFKVAGWIGIAMSVILAIGFLVIMSEQGYIMFEDCFGLAVVAVLVSTSIGSIKGKH